MGIPTLIDPRMLSQVGAAPPLQEVIKPSGLPPLPSPTVPIPAPVVPTGMGMDAMPRPAAPPVQQAGNGFAQMLVKSIPMLLAGIVASKGGRPAMTGLLEGYTSSLERKRILDQRQHEFDVQQAATEDERQIRQQNYQAQQQERIGTYITNALNYLDKVDDPGTYKAAVQQLDDAGVKAYGLPAGFIANRLSGAFDTTKATAKVQKDAEGVVTRARARYGDQFDEVAAGGATMKGPDGKERPLSEWQAMAGDAQAVGPDGKPIVASPRPKSEFDLAVSEFNDRVKEEETNLGRPLTPTERTTLRNKMKSEAATAGHVVDPETARHNRAMEAAAAATAGDKRIWVTRNGAPIFINPSQVQPGDEPFKGGQKSVTGAERQSLAFYNRAKEANTITSEIEPTIAQMGLPGQARLQYAPGWLQSDENRAYRQAQRSFTEARLRKESGAAISADEYNKDSITYFAQPGDTQATITQKQKARQALLDGMAFTAGGAYEEFYGEPRQKPGPSSGTNQPNVKVDTQAVPANVAAALKGQKPGKHTLSDGSVWIVGADGSIAKWGG